MPTAQPSVRSASGRLLRVQRMPGGGREGLRLVGVEGEVPPPDLEEVPLCAEPRRTADPARCGRRARPGTRRREVVEQRGERVEARAVHQPVGVVEDEQPRWPTRCSSAARRGTATARTRGPGAAMDDADRRVDRLDPIDRGRKVREEDARVVVEVVEGEPRDGSVLARGPLGEDDGLAVSGRRDDGDDRGPGLGRQQAGEPGRARPSPGATRAGAASPRRAGRTAEARTRVTAQVRACRCASRRAGLARSRSSMPAAARRPIPQNLPSAAQPPGPSGRRASEALRRVERGADRGAEAVEPLEGGVDVIVCGERDPAGRPR